MAELTFDQQKIIGILNYKKALVFLVTRENKGIKCRTRRFTGISTITQFKGEAGARYQMDLVTSCGQATVVAVQNGEYVVLAEDHFQGEIELNLSLGATRLRLIGKQADVLLTFRLLDN